MTIPYPWLATAAALLESRLARNQVPQALLIHGPGGIGRRDLASWFAIRLLPPTTGSHGAPGPGGFGHPDCLLLTPEEEKKVITVGQVRELIEFLRLTSYRGGRKVAVICPAEAMNTAAANSLLKTLEEPAGATTIILVAGALSRLPATVISRCQRLRLAIPPRSVVLEWLGAKDASVPWAELLDICGGAPLLARDLAEQGFAAAAGDLADDLGRLMRREESPPAVARRWARLDSQFCLRWLCWRVAGLIRAGLGDPDSAGVGKNGNLPLKNAHGRLNMTACYAYLDRLQQARRLVDRPLNQELQFADLLMWWYGLSGTAK